MEVHSDFLQKMEEDTEAYRDSIATVDKDGKRIWLYPKKPSGRYYNARTIVSFIFLAIFLVLPFIKYNGEQLFLFNVLERKFIFFGILFTPQDFHLFVLVLLTFFVFIILFTVVFGRLFCGWVCPQTVFMEMFFRRIEYWIEGDAGAQRKLDASPWTAEKIRKKTLKHVIFFAIAFVVSNYFLAYIITMEEVLKIVREPVTEHWGGFFAILGFSGVFYGVFARMREQVCTTICPYGRLQGVLLVKDSIVVAYDHKRGEPRGKLKKILLNKSSQQYKAIASTVNYASQFVQQVLIFGTAHSWNALTVPRALMLAIRSWKKSISPRALFDMIPKLELTAVFAGSSRLAYTPIVLYWWHCWPLMWC